MTTISHSRILRFVANATLAYPLASMGLLYGYWLLAWLLLGHKPVIDTDDAALIPIGFTYVVVAIFAIVLAFPISVGAIAVNVVYVLEELPSASQVGIRAISLVSLWLGWYVWVLNDPHDVLTWFFD